MITAEKSSFGFVDFKITRSFFDFEKERGNELNVEFYPHGKFFVKTNLFRLYLSIEIVDIKKEKLIEIATESIFKFNNIDEDNLYKFFTLNAPAIIFPYIRAYISTLTIQSGFKPILLPTLNLVALSEELNKNIEKVEV